MKIVKNNRKNSKVFSEKADNIVISDIDAEVDTITASEIQSRPIIWAYEPYIPMGTVTILLGEGGEGKSFYALALAAAISKGLPLPGMDKAAMPPSDILIQNAENPWGTVIKPRLEMLGADCSRIHSINDSEKQLTLTDSRIEAAIRKHKVRMVFIDPWQSYLSENFSMNRSESVRPALIHLERVAERTESAIVLIGHVNKSRGKAQHRGLGSIDVINAVPSVLYLGRAEGLDPDVRAVAVGKCNFAEIGITQLFRLNKTDGFSWAGESEDITPDDIMHFSAVRVREDKSKVDEAVDFLYDVLSDESLPSANVIAQADEAGISKRTLERARKTIGVKPKQLDGQWVLSLPGEEY